MLLGLLQKSRTSLAIRLSLLSLFLQQSHRFQRLLQLKLRVGEAQEVLQIEDALARLRKVDALLRRELDVTTVQAEIQSQALDEMSRGQREAFLREQLRAIQAERGEADSRGDEADEYRGKIEEAGMSEEALAEAQKQVRRLERMHPDGPEAQVVRNYLDWMVDLPWSVASPDRLDLANAQAILDEDHAHLQEIKDRILEYLGVRKLRSESPGPILCFVGPPGVGKTSLGRSIARALGREFARASLGGVRDEAEIRGHRRTYIGAMPGKILQSLKKAGSSNPVFLLDEIDKMSMDFRGDPSSALLEVLDPEQNNRFSDHYLNVPFDLSRVLFIATANLLDSIPSPLLDRMEVIRLPGYTEDEKVQIARRHLIAKQMKNHAVNEAEWSISEQALRDLIRMHTREAGVRNLEREIANLIRKAVKEIAMGKCQTLRITRRNLEKFAGVKRFRYGEAELEDQVGIVTGLAWTEVGGELLTIEGVMMPGKGKITVTGNLRDVMTVAHELGHGVHQTLAAEQGLFEQDTPLTTAETASVFGEMLVFRRLMREESDPAVRLALLCGKLEDAFATVFRQVAMTRFEQMLHTARREEGELPTERVNEIWMEANRPMFGDSVALSDDYAWWWLYIPHFVHSPFYCYAYAYGELLVLALLHRYDEEGDAFAPRYLDLLRAGGSDAPDALLSGLGIDVTDPGFWGAGVRLLEGMVSEAEELAS